MRFSFALFATVLSVGSAFASNVLELTPDNFDEHIGKGKPALVEFFAPWCGHCKNLAPTYEQLADAFANSKDKVIIAKVDADGAGKPLGQKYGVTGFPTLKWFGADGGEPQKYDGGRDLDALANFVTAQSGVKSSIKPPPPPAYQILDAHTFEEVALNPEKDAIVAFTAPWCGHCKRLKPIYEEVAKDFASEPNCIIANVDADDKKNRALAEKYEISSFPTIIFYPKGNKEDPVDYDGPRTEEAFVEYLNEKCGTHRALGGLLDDKVGRLEQLDALASKFFEESAAARQTLLKEASTLAATLGDGAKHYIRVMEKVVNGSEEYLEKESTRLATILQKRTLAPGKLDEIKVKANILGAFRPVVAKVEEAVEEAKEEIKRDTAEL
ncbi:protein disulfide isomerase [Trametes versicolor FP-101664 SS1]|uniref:protein disulfide isomerase n=1 Tax=Trametes versicolor (strain FP-101664) TaxID=717944 RepID=UPI00046248DE|nr:protein disulfide isomerase [Trametes versicolor FP-101664 SS1]EIW54716.1 protein disulfide isomerase [Trametes versicolor FP-101664 SS1]